MWKRGQRIGSGCVVDRANGECCSVAEVEVLKAEIGLNALF